MVKKMTEGGRAERKRERPRKIERLMMDIQKDVRPVSVNKEQRSIRSQRLTHSRPPLSSIILWSFVALHR